MDIPQLPKTIRKQDQIIATWKDDISVPLVSVRCVTYNHAPYIEDAIKGFLIQETTFPIEIWIHDDASTDGTREIVEEYQSRYPKIIKTILQRENQYSKNVKPGIILTRECKGKYIAVCEGDDYWTDPNKLQIQVDFLEKNPEYVISGHDACIIDENDRLIQDSKLPEIHKRDYSTCELQQGDAFILTLSWVFRRVLQDDEAIAERSIVKNGDNFQLSLLGQYGAAHYHDDIEPAVYRVHEGGVWSSLDIQARQQAQATTFLMISNYYRRIGQNDMAEVWWRRSANRVVASTRSLELFRELVIRLTLARQIRGAMRRVKSYIMSEKV